MASLAAMPEGRSIAGARVLVTEAGLPQSLTVVRALAAQGVHVVAADGVADSIAFRSRSAAATAVYPPAEEDPAAAVDAILAAARDHRVDLVIPNTDRVTVALSEARDRFAGVCRVALPSPEALERSRDKDATVALARDLGIDVPRTTLVRSVEEARAAAREIGYPVALKPQYSHQPVGGEVLETFPVAFAADDDELARRMAELEGRSAVLLQEHVRGSGEGVELLLHEGRVLAAFQHRRLREVPPTGGMSSLRESVPLDPVRFRQAADLLGAMGWTGLAMVEFRGTPQRTTLMEVNGRIWGSLALAVRAGMDFPGRLVAMELHGPPPPDAPPVTSYEIGVRVRNLALELRWASSVARQSFPHRAEATPSRWRSLAVAGALLWPGNDFDIQLLTDPVPGLLDAGREVGELLRRAAGGPARS